jgi:bifunctional non-homologous end joining protein LigD
VGWVPHPRDGRSEGVRLTSRRGSVADAWFPELGDLPAGLHGHVAVLDGEVIVCGDDGRPAFHLLRQRLGGRPAKQPPATYMLFDLLELNGEALYRRPWHERRRRLESLGIDSPGWQVPRWFPGDDLTDVLDATRSLGLEGVVMKRRDAPYEPGRRSASWIKVKHFRYDQLAVGAIRPPTRSHPLSGLVAGWPRDDGLLDYAAVVEIGFSPGERSALMSSLERCRTDAAPS